MIAKKTQLLAVAATFLMQLVVQANDISEEYEFQQVLPTRIPVELDGVISDEEWGHANEIVDPPFYIPKSSGAAGTLVTFETLGDGTWEGSDDFSLSTRFMYDSENLYIAFTVVDDYHENAANSAWNGDTAQIMIANGDRDMQVGLYNFALAGAEADPGFSPICGPAVDPCIVNEEAGPGGVDAAIIRNNSDGVPTTTYEIRISAAAMGIDQPELGGQIGFGVAVNDGDFLTPGQKGWGGLGAHALVFGKAPIETALLFFDEEVIGNLPCDFNGDTVCDVVDLDELLYTGLGGSDAKYDLNNSGGAITLADRDEFLRQVNSYPGDFDLDGKVVAGDLNTLGGNWTKDGLTSYAQGDSNGDGVANASDLNDLGTNWQKGVAAAPLASAVPEPVGYTMLITGLLGLLAMRRRS